MMTIRQIERLWTAGKFARLTRDLLAARPEASIRLESALGNRDAAAAMTLIRLDELSQSHHAICPLLIRTLIASQNTDGGWGEPAITAVVLRALLTSGGHGVVVDRGRAALAQLQKAEGAWPTGPLRRMPEDPFATAFILFCLGGDDAFRATVHFDEAISWFAAHRAEFDAETRRLWDRAAVRCQVRSESPSALGTEDRVAA